MTRNTQGSEKSHNLCGSREDLRKEILAWEHGKVIRRTTIDELNRLMLQHPMGQRLIAHGRVYASEVCLELREPEYLFAPWHTAQRN